MRLTHQTTSIEVEPDYLIRFKPGPFQFITMGAIYGTPAEHFDHPNVCCIEDKYFEFKHYRRGGSKFWTGKPGVEFTFAIAKERIEVPLAKGYSYVDVYIDGVKYTLNVSGGTGGDWVGLVAGTFCRGTLKGLRTLAESATSPDAVREFGTLPIRTMAKEQVMAFWQSVAKVRMLPMIRTPGLPVYTAEGYTWAGSNGPFITEQEHPAFMRRRRQSLIAKDEHGRVRIKFNQIDWLRTAEARNITIPEPRAINRIGEVVPYEQTKNTFSALSEILAETSAPVVTGANAVQ